MSSDWGESACLSQFYGGFQTCYTVQNIRECERVRTQQEPIHVWKTIL